MLEPLVSLIVPNYNSALFIEEFINSVTAQTYSNWELIIVDDASTDNSPAIIQEYVKKDSRIKYYERDHRGKGACQRRNQGLDVSNGSLICFFDADDILPKETIAIRVSEILSDSNLDFVVCPAISFHNKPYDIQRLVLGLPIFEDDLKMFLSRFRLPFGVWTNIYRKEYFTRTGLQWDENLSSLQDSDLNIRGIALGARYKYSNNSAPGYFWRTGGNPNSISKTIKKRFDLDSQYYFYTKLLKLFENTKYLEDVKRFGLTLMLRYAQHADQAVPDNLIETKSIRIRYKILRFLYRKQKIRNVSALINLFFFPIKIGKEYLFIINNRKMSKKYIANIKKDTVQ